MLNLDSGDNVNHHHDDIQFWQSVNTEGSASSALVGGYKSPAFSLTSGHTEVLIVVHSNGTELGRSRYSLLPDVQTLTLQDMLSTMSNQTITSVAAAQSGASGAGHNPYREQSLGGDLFVSHPHALVINKTSGWTAAQNLTRIATTLSNADYSHTFAGLGGKHQNGTGSYGTLYESAPISAYCDIVSGYGNGANYSSFTPGSFPISSSCKHASFAFVPADTAVFLR